MAGVVTPLQGGTHFLFFFFALWTVSRASSIRADIKVFNLFDTMLVHAHLCKKVLAHWTPLAILDAKLPIDARITIFSLPHQCTPRLFGKDLEVSEIAIVHVLAVLIVEALIWHVLVR